MQSCVLMNIHPMVGIDNEKTITPGTPPVPAGNTPHFCVQVLGGVVFKAKLTTKTYATYGFLPLQVTSDIGNLIGHVGAPNILLPLIIAFSSSKSNFGASTVLFENSPVAAALLGSIHLNQNCGSPIPNLTGLVICPNTVLAGMTLGDFLAGALLCAANMVFSKIMAKFGDRVSGPVAQAITRNLVRTAAYRALFNRAVRTLIYPAVNAGIKKVLDKSADTALGAIGSLTGLTFSNGARTTGRAVDNLNDSGVEHLN